MRQGILKLIVVIILIISLYLNYKLIIKTNTLKSDLKSCQEIADSCTTTYNKTVEEYNESQIRASSTIQKLQKTIVDKTFEDCLNMRIPDTYLRVYRNQDSSCETGKTNK